jgi:hypothetical protein
MVPVDKILQQRNIFTPAVLRIQDNLPLTSRIQIQVSHWSSLTDPTYSQYGFYVGSGPAIVATQPCSVTDLSGAGIDIKQYLMAHGCSFTIENSVYLVIELS